MKQDYGRSGSEFDNEMKRMLAARKISKLSRRILFQIKWYRKPVFGEALSRVITGGDLYVAYMSNDQVTSDEFSKFSRSYFVANTDEGLKIVYFMYLENGSWKHMHGYEPTQILDPGELVEISSIKAPVDPVSLAIYNEK